MESYLRLLDQGCNQPRVPFPVLKFTLEPHNPVKTPSPPGGKVCWFCQVPVLTWRVSPFSCPALKNILTVSCSWFCIRLFMLQRFWSSLMKSPSVLVRSVLVWFIIAWDFLKPVLLIPYPGESLVLRTESWWLVGETELRTSSFDSTAHHLYLDAVFFLFTDLASRRVCTIIWLRIIFDCACLCSSQLSNLKKMQKNPTKH